MAAAGGADGQSPEHPTHMLQFKNLGQRSLPVSVVFWVPIQLNQVAVWDAPQVTFSQVSPTGPEERTQLLPPDSWSFLKPLILLLDFGAISDPRLDLGPPHPWAGAEYDLETLISLSHHSVLLSSEPLQYVPHGEEGPPPL